VTFSANSAYDLEYASTEAVAAINDSEPLKPRPAQRMLHRGSPWVNTRARRCLECVVAAGALLVLSPILLACALLVRLSSPGPILFRQRRMGRNGSEFTLYKFRSMQFAARDGEPGHTVAGDRRITSAGALLRRYKLDELPQFWNVLIGDMALVGPRPKLACHEGLHMAFRPGITGAATLTFRNEEAMLIAVPARELDSFYEKFIKPVKAALDSAYMQKATLRSDARLLFLTAVSCFGTRGEHPLTLHRSSTSCEPEQVHFLHFVSGVQSSAPGSSPAPAAAD
jgi:lipopolysaccharide/colanic/teichoic acid biosynthesis glycosyltransferase